MKKPDTHMYEEACMSGRYSITLVTRERMVTTASSWICSRDPLLPGFAARREKLPSHLEAAGLARAHRGDVAGARAVL